MFVTRIVFICSIGVLSALPAFSEGGPGFGKGPGPDGPGHGAPLYGDISRFKEKLSLTDEQVAKIESVNKKYVGEYNSIHQKMNPRIEELRKLARQEKIDAAKLRASYADMVKLQGDSRMMRLNHFLEIEQILTPDQSRQVRKELPFLMEERMMQQQKRMKERREDRR